MKVFITFIVLAFFYATSFSQYESTHHSEIGIEIQAASASTHGGTVGGALRYAYVIDSQIVVGPTLRLQYIWSKSVHLGTESNSFTWGGGGFFHYRFLNWFYLGADVELLKNPYRYKFPKKKWSLVGLLGGGIAHQFGPVVLSAGIMYDVVDAIRDPHTSNPSPLSGGYFLRVTNPKKPNTGKLIPLLYKITLFIPIG